LSVSRVGGKTQLPSYRSIASDLRLSYAQFEELEAFARFGTRLDEDTKRTLERGKRIRELLKQPQYGTWVVADQIVSLLALTAGLFDPVDVDRMAEAGEAVREGASRGLPDIWRGIARG